MTVIDFRAGAYDDDYGPQHDSRYHAPSWADEPDYRDDDAARYATDAGRAPLLEGFAGRVARLLNYLGALVSVALMVGLAVWGYRLVTRDVSGVPVIQALAGDARVAPDNPGGEMGEAKGLAVNEIAAGSGPGRVESVAIAPAAPGLTEEDVAMGALGATPRSPGLLSETAPAEPEMPVVAVADAEAALLAKAEAESRALALGEPLPAIEPAPATQAEAVERAVAAAALPGIAVSARPQPRPQRSVRVASADPAAVIASTSSSAVTLAEAPAPAPKAAAAKPAPAPAEAPRTVKQASLPAGSMVVQIGAFDSDAIARGEWDRVAGKNGGLFAGKSQIVQKTEKAGRTFWRLRVAGFASPEEARSFCASLKAAGTDCIPTAVN